MKKIVSAALALAVGSAFGLGSLAIGSPAVAQEQMQEKAPDMKTNKSKKADKATKMRGSKQVMALQEALNQNGAKLQVDGRMGKQTRAALKDYQSKNGLKPSGQLDKETRAKLGL